MKKLLMILVLLLSGCATDARLQAENTDLKLRIHLAEDRLVEQQGYVAETQDRDQEIQSNALSIFNQMNEDMEEFVDQVKAEARAEARSNCGA